MSDAPRHLSVLQTVASEILSLRPGETVLDVTVGLGGHAADFLASTGPDGTLIGLDADSDNLALARERLASFSSRVRLHHLNFGLLPTLSLAPVDVIFADLGLSSPHIDTPERGFSFRAQGPLDLRFDRTSGQPASVLLERADEHMLVTVFRRYGELKDIRRLIAAIRETTPQTTQDLVACATTAYGWQAPKFLPQIFQAVRMWVNDEMSSLAVLLQEGPKLLRPGGRMAVISFHSLEDREVKQTFRSLCTPEKDPITGAISKQADFILLTSKPLRPDDEETRSNPRARSALLRAIKRS